MCKNISFADLLGSQKLIEILQIPHTVKDSENMVKSGCLEKCLGWRVPNFFRNEGGIWCPCWKNIDILLNYEEIGIYLEYCTPDPLWKY